jgi:hypothetical protein
MTQPDRKRLDLDLDIIGLIAALADVLNEPRPEKPSDVHRAFALLIRALQQRAVERPPPLALRRAAVAVARHARRTIDAAALARGRPRKVERPAGNRALLVGSERSSANRSQSNTLGGPRSHRSRRAP